MVFAERTCKPPLSSNLTPQDTQTAISARDMSQHRARRYRDTDRSSMSPLPISFTFMTPSSVPSASTPCLRKRLHASGLASMVRRLKCYGYAAFRLSVAEMTAQHVSQFNRLFLQDEMPASAITATSTFSTPHFAESRHIGLRIDRFFAATNITALYGAPYQPHYLPHPSGSRDTNRGPRLTPQVANAPQREQP